MSETKLRLSMLSLASSMLSMSAAVQIMNDERKHPLLSNPENSQKIDTHLLESRNHFNEFLKRLADD